MIWNLFEELLQAILLEIDRVWKGQLSQEAVDDLIILLSSLKNQYENQIISSARIQIVDTNPYPAGDIWKPVLPKFSKLTDDLERKLVDDIKYFRENGIGRQEALQAIKNRFNTTEGYTRVLFNTASLALRNKQKMDFALGHGAEWFVYAGVGAMRPFCKEHLWNAYHIDEIMKMDNKQKLPVIYFCGGYNCLHGWDEIPKSQFKEYPRIALYK